MKATTLSIFNIKHVVFMTTIACMLLSYVFINPTTASASSLNLQELNTVSEVLDDAEAIL